MGNRVYEKVVEYHERTKHHYHRYARSAGHMDWQNQPNPFRVYKNADTFSLPFLEKDPGKGHMSLYRMPSAGPEPFTLNNIAGFLELSLGLSAWKASARGKWSLRMNPSSGNLHPTEAHLILPEADDLRAGIYHYNPLLHALELRAELPHKLWQTISAHFGTGGFLVALSSIFWRESWKYGERAFRYCNHDAGHALAGISFSAGLQGWRTTFLNALSDDALETTLGFNRTDWLPREEEHPDLLCFVSGYHVQDIPRYLPDNIVEAFSELPLAGAPNRLSRERVDWQLIYETAELTRKPTTAGEKYDLSAIPFLENARSALSAAEIIRKRRSATSFNPDGVIDKNRFFAILDKTLPRTGCLPFDIQFGNPSVNLLLFVHNVRELERGLYFFMRDTKDLQSIRNNFHPDFVWQQITEKLPLYLLQSGDFRHEAIQLSCHQEIAGFSAFSLGMIARFSETVRSAPYRYRHLFWESGMIGQVLYLEAEAQGVRGTGIGCYFDDPVHELLGLQDNTWQSLYHFTIGLPVEDPRLTTLPPYSHLENSRNK